MIFVRSFPKVLSAVGLLLLAGCGANSAIERSRGYERLGDYQHAFEELHGEFVRQQRAGEVEAELAREHERVRRAFLRDRAQRLIFQEKEDLALRDLDALAEADPDYPGLAALRAAAHRKQARRIVARGYELLAEDRYADAMKEFLASQRLVPGLEEADDGIASVRAELQRLNARARAQFLEAVRKVPEFRHVEVAWHAASVINSTPDPDDEQRHSAEKLRLDARRASARETMARALECEHENRFGAAQVLYKAALLLDPEIEDAKAGIERMQNELRAQELIEKAQLLMRNGHYADARGLLDDAFERSTLSRGAISELMIEVRKLEAKAEYRAARDLEVMGKKAEALAAFEALAEKYPDGVEDEQARIAALKVDIEGAKVEWRLAEEAEQAGDLEKALGHYQSAEAYYPEWRDGERHIERLKRAIAQRKAGEVEGGGSDGGN
ncbi:MAG TPA: hypothetical protein ENI87_05040 [bacterium]|nr:hypothetical protein [bacterium]